MTLADLKRANGNYKVVLVQTSSVSLQQFIQDLVREGLGTNADTVYEAKTKATVKGIRAFFTTQPYMSKRWFCFVDLDSIGGIKELTDVIKDSTTVTFFCTTSRYANYKKFKEAVKNESFVYDLYISSLKHDDFLFLYKAIVPENNKLTKQMYDYVYQSYRYDISAVMDLFKALKNGADIQTRKEIADVCGVGSNSIENFVLSLLGTPPSTEKGVKTVLRNRVKSGIDLAETYGNWRAFYRLINSCVDCFIDIKMLKISGTIYKRVRDLPDGYDEAKLARYQRYIWRLNDIPLSLLLTLKMHLANRVWFEPSQFFEFIYYFIEERIATEVIPNLPKADTNEILKEEREKQEKARKAAEYAKAKEDKEYRLELIKKFGIVKAREMLAASNK